MTYHIASASLALLLVSTAIGVAADPQRREWESQFHPVSIQYSPSWTLLEASYDRPDRLVVAFVQHSKGETVRDSKDGYAYVIKVTEDVPKDLVSDEALIESNKQKMIKRGGLTFIDQATVSFHQKNHVRLRFRGPGKVGDVCQHAYFHRTGTWFISVQCIFPYEQQLIENEEMPAMIKELDQSVEIFEKAKAES